VLVFANKQDMDGALSATELNRELQLDTLKQISRVQRCVAHPAHFKTGDSSDPDVFAGLDWLLKEIRSQHTQLRDRIERDVAARPKSKAQSRAPSAAFGGPSDMQSGSARPPASREAN
jgi:hypothetical protein